MLTLKEESQSFDDQGKVKEASLWSKRQDRTLTNAAYNEIGGVTGALAQRAEYEFARFTTAEQTAARRLFSRLVRVARPEEGAEDTRQRLELQAADAETEKVAQALARPEVRLLVMGRPETDVPDANPTVEVAHEALIRNWERLRSWLNEDREFLLWRQRKQIQVEQWEQHGRDASYLLRGVSLSDAERWLIGRPQDLMAGEREFIEASVALREQEWAIEERRRHAEVENAIQLKEAAEAKAKAEQRNAQLFRRVAWGLGALLLVATCATIFAFWQRTLAHARELVSASNASQDGAPDLSILLAAQSVAVAWPPWGHTVLPLAEDQLHRAILLSKSDRLTLRGHNSDVTSMAWSPDGKRLATASADQTAKVWDAASEQELLTLRGHNSYVLSVAWSPDGKRLATASLDRTVQTYAIDIHDLMKLARQRIIVRPSAESCKKYLQVDRCPPFPKLSWWSSTLWN